MHRCSKTFGRVAPLALLLAVLLPAFLGAWPGTVVAEPPPTPRAALAAEPIASPADLDELTFLRAQLAVELALQPALTLNDVERWLDRLDVASDPVGLLIPRLAGWPRADQLSALGGILHAGQPSAALATDFPRRGSLSDASRARLATVVVRTLAELLEAEGYRPARTSAIALARLAAPRD